MLGRALAIGTSEVGGVVQRPLPDEADIGREFPRDLVAQPSAQLDVAEAAAELTVGRALGIEVGFDLRGQDEAIGEADLVGALGASAEAAVVADVAGQLDIEPVGRQALDAGGEPSGRPLPRS